MNIDNQSGYCPLFFKGMYVEKKDDTTLQQGHCCSSSLGPRINQIDFYNYPQFVQSRTEWANKAVTGCEVCWQAEQQGQHSFRKGWLRWLDDQEAVDPFTTELLKLDYNVGPICNAKCVHCTSNYSSLWAAEDANFGTEQIIQYSSVASYGEVAKLDIISSLDVSQLRSLYINGGEPFLSEDPQRLLQKIKQQGSIEQLHFQSNTNGSVRPSDDFIDLLLQCNAVDIFVSIDAIEQQFEYVRHPLNWQAVTDNIRFLANIDPKIKVKFSFSVGLHNIDELERTWQWFLNNRVSHNQTMESFGIHPCYGELSLNNVTAELQQIWIDSLYPRGYWTPYVTSLLTRGSAASNQSWIDYFDKLDHRRSLDWRKSLPGLKQSLDRVNTA